MAGDTDKGAITPGNKPLGSVEVKISDLKFFEMLGQGAGGCVKKVVHRPTKKFLALKEIPFKQDNDLRKRLIIELKTLHDCNHDNVLKYYGSFEREGNLIIALEFMDAGSLASILHKVHNISEAILGLITVQILQGLNYMHKKHIMHRDIKPANILLNKNGIVKLADFGVSGMLEDTQDGLSTFCGTMAYMAPERLKGAKKYFADTDLWSLGIILVECATGRCPY